MKLINAAAEVCERGQAAYHRGDECSPQKDTKISALMSELTIAESSELMKAWRRGWEEAADDAREAVRHW